MPGIGTPPRKRRRKEIQLPRLGENMKWRTKNDSRNNRKPQPPAKPRPKVRLPSLFSPYQQRVNARVVSNVRGIIDNAGKLWEVATGKKKKK
jgi:hypothetical protein